MNAIGIAFTFINVLLIFVLPRRLAALPLLVGTCYVTVGQVIQVGPFNFTAIRILIACGLLRVVIRREVFSLRLNLLDWLMCLFTLWCLFSSFFHKNFTEASIYRLGIAYNYFGVYILVRILYKSIDDIETLFRIVALVLIPVSVAMMVEKLLGQNIFSIFGAVSEFSAIRQGQIRAQGPFRHPILAGTVGAVCLPIMIGIWQRSPKLAISGGIACVTIVFACASSGPILSSLISIGAMMLWVMRNRMRVVRWLAILGYIALDLIMNDPAYFIIAKIDAVGGSTGWHRARLIQSSIEHIEEWWFAGTDYTRHWMPTGVSWSPDHTDITNHYLAMGVIGGLILMILFIVKIIVGYIFVGKTLKNLKEFSDDKQFFVWSLGASLLAHTMTSISVSYFDQSFVFIYLTLAALGSLPIQPQFAKANVLEPLIDINRFEYPKAEELRSRKPMPLFVTKRILIKR